MLDYDEYVLYKPGRNSLSLSRCSGKRCGRLHDFLTRFKIYLSSYLLSWKNNNYKFQNLTLPSQYNTSFKHGVRMGAPVFKTLHLWWFLAVLDSIHYLHYILIGSPKRHTSPNSHGAQSSILIT